MTAKKLPAKKAAKKAPAKKAAAARRPKPPPKPPEPPALRPSAAMRKSIDEVLERVSDGGNIDLETVKGLGAAVMVKAWAGILDGTYPIRHAGQAVSVAKQSVQILAVLGATLDDPTKSVDEMTPEEAREELVIFTEEIRKNAGVAPQRT